MAIEFDSQPFQRQDYRLGVVDLVTRPFGLWFKNIIDYLVLFILGTALTTLITFVLFYAVFGVSSGAWASLFGGDLLTAIVNLLTSSSGPLVFAIILIVVSLVSLVVNALIGGTAIKHSLDAYDHQVEAGSQYEETSPVRLGQSFSVARSHFWSLVLVQLAVSLIMSLIMAPSLVYLTLIIGSINPYDVASLYVVMGLLPVLLLSAIVMYYVSIRFSVALAVPIVENKGVVDSIKRSWELTGGNFWHVFMGRIGVTVLILLGTTLLSQPVAYLVYWVGIWAVLMTGFVNAVFAPINYTFLSVLYRDLESRTAVKEREFW